HRDIVPLARNLAIDHRIPTGFHNGSADTFLLEHGTQPLGTTADIRCLVTDTRLFQEGQEFGDESALMLAHVRLVLLPTCWHHGWLSPLSAGLSSGTRLACPHFVTFINLVLTIVA